MLYFPGTHIPMYGLCIAVGIVTAGFFSIYTVKKKGLDVNDAYIIAAVIVGFGVAGAKLLYLLQNFKEIDWSRMADAAYAKMVFGSGFVFYGGLIGGVLGLLVLEKGFRISVLPYVGQCIFALPIAHAFGRVGCHFASCCYGIPYNGFPHIVYHNALFAPNDVSLFPVQLCEAGINFLLAGYLFRRSMKNKDAVNSIFIYGYAYAIFRFVLEFFRGDQIRGNLGALSTSQIISVVIVFLLTAVLAVRKKQKKTSISPF
ncbi:MAG: prolipoprotein diacylglyceryl transferase [Clostridiaceae bacterium]|nr:prolipoprotein diacylglyceryl transferase [Clostridiaceae bacterium]